MVRIIDCETHPVIPVGVDAAYRTPGTTPDRASIQRIAADSIAENRFEGFGDDLISQMDRHGVEKALVMRGALACPNDELARLVRAHPDRLAAFASWGTALPNSDPVEESRESIAELDRALSDPTFVGVGEVSLARRFAPRLSPADAAQAFTPTLEVCQKYNRPIMFHTGSAGPAHEYEYRDPLNLAELASAFPDVPFLVGHLGGNDETYFLNSILLARQHSNVFLTASVTTQQHIEHAVAEIGAERLLFGTDWSGSRPVLEHEAGISAYEYAINCVRRAAIEEHERELILGENLAGLVGI